MSTLGNAGFSSQIFKYKAMLLYFLLYIDYVRIGLKYGNLLYMLCIQVYTLYTEYRVHFNLFSVTRAFNPATETIQLIQGAQRPVLFCYLVVYITFIKHCYR